MRLLAILPVLCCTVALILTFLCLFAGHKKDFLEDYHLLTLNTSRIGTTLFNSTADAPSSNPLTNLWNDLTNNVQDKLNQIAGSMAEELGVEDFYSAHMLGYCEGDYTPAVMPNATLSASDIHKNVSECSKARAMYTFNPTEILEHALSESGVDVSLDDLHWPADIQNGIDALNTVVKTAFVLYCIGIALIFVALVASVIAFFGHGRLSACVNIMFATLAFLAVGLASALITAMIVKGCDKINQYASDVGVDAQKGNKFLALTWASTGVLFIALVAWAVETCFGGKRRERAYSKHG